MCTKNQKNQQSANKKDSSISLKKAKEETKRWRKFLEKKCEDYELKTINRGAFIPFKDIEKIKDLYDSDKKIIGVRAYFALEKAETKEDRTPLHHVKLILVPVEEDGKNGRDILEVPSKEGLSKNQSTIYDFTMPCPDCCDETSQLY